jgi:integrase
MASTRCRNGKWTALYRDRAGDQKSAGTYGTKKIAQAKANAAEALEASGQDAKLVLGSPEMLPTLTRRGHVTVEGYGPDWLAGHRLEDTSRESYGFMLKHIYSGLGSVPVRDLDAPKVRSFIRALEGKMSGATVGHVMTVLRELCKTAVEDRILIKDPTEGIKIADRRAREMTILTPAEYWRVLAAIEPGYQLLVRTLISTGLRWGECIALRPDDIIQDGDRWSIKVRRTIAEVGGKQSERDYGKTAKAMRSITIDADLASELTACPQGHIFTAARGGRLQRSNFRRVWIKALDQAGVKGVRVHDLRHTHASWLVNNGADLVSVRDRLGHTDIKTTSRYLHAIPRQRDGNLDALGRALAAA